MVVFKILTRNCQHGWKEHLKICKAARFESDFLETNKDIPLQSHENLQTLVWWGARCSPYTHTHTPPPPPPPYVQMQRAKKVVSDSPGLVDFAIGLVNSVINLPDGQVNFFEEFK